MAAVDGEHSSGVERRPRMSVPLDAAQAALAKAMSALYNSAQRDVMTRAIELAPAEDGANTQA